MKIFSIIVSFVFAISLSSLSQENDNWLAKKIKGADTVLLTSHNATAGVRIISDSTGNDLQLPKLTIAGRPNYSITKEQQIISGAQLDTLVKILDRPFEDKTVEMGKCFIPHHAIFLIKNGKTSYIDICFGCRGYDSSKDLNKLNAFDKRKWTELEDFFRRLGFKYDLPLQSE